MWGMCLPNHSKVCPCICLLAANRNLTDDGFRSVTRLAGTLTELVLEGGHEVSEDGATALALLTRLQSLCLGFR